MGNYQNASGGLKKMYIAELGAIVCAVLSIIPLVNIIAAIAAIVFMVLSIVGLYCVGKDIPGCQKAFMVTIISLVVSVFKAIFKTGIMSAIFAIAGDVLSFLVVYLVCTSVAEVMVQLAAPDIADKGNSVWKINLVCYAVSAILSVLSIIPLINIIAAVLQVVVAIVQIVALVLYMIFLKKSSEKLAS